MTVTTELDLGDRQVIILNDQAQLETAFEEVCRRNPDARIEQTSDGDIIIMAPAGGESGFQSGEAFRQLSNWAARDRTGWAFDSSAGFKLPNGAKRSPDASWVHRGKLIAISKAARKSLLPFAPDFAIEVVSPSDRFKDQEQKCQEYIATGSSEVWLIDPQTQTVSIYAAGREPDRLVAVDTVTSQYLSSFTLHLQPIWRGLDL